MPHKENIKKPNKGGIRACKLEKLDYYACGISSRMGGREFSSLTLHAFHEGYDPDAGITMFDMRRAKVESDSITFISPEVS